VNDKARTEQQLLDELARLRGQVAELERDREQRSALYAARVDRGVAQALQRRNQELALLNQMTHAFTATLDLDEVIFSVLEETRRLLDVVGTSIWLLDPQAKDLVCWQSTGAGGEIVRGWRLKLGEGLAGWVARSGQTLVVPDALTDERHFRDVDRRTGVALRSILSLPLKVKQEVIGVLQVLDTEVDRFDGNDLALLEPLGAAAAVAIDNARLYQETDRLRAFNENIVQSMEEGILLEDPQGQITFVNRKTAELLGYEPHELVGQPWEIIAAPEYAAQVASETDKRAQGIAGQYETVLRTRQDDPVPVLASARPLFEDGRYDGVLSVFTDITALKQAEEELRQSQAKLERARRMESLGVLAGGVAHDLNNLLGPMMAYPDLMLAELPEDSPLREDVRQIKLAAGRSAAMVQDLLTLARRGVYRMAPLNLNMVVNEYLRSPAFADLKRDHPGVSVHVDLAPDLLNISGSPVHLSKVMMNLVSNAFEAMPDGGSIIIRTSCLSLDRPVAGYEYIKAGDYVVLRVTDTGVGIGIDDVSHIFEPFYTKKEMGRSGSGLGLAVVYGVAHDHGARIDLQTELGQGSEFTLYIPVVQESFFLEDERDEDYRGDETVLVVDDLQEQRDVATRLLSSLGYQVVAVPSGRAAVNYLRTHRADILVLDMIMQENLDGLGAYRQIVKLNPGQKAVIASGFSETARVKETQELGAGPFVRKPYTLSSLGKAVRSELDRQ
jgi:PAS domain S-box-containing protein